MDAAGLAARVVEVIADLGAAADSRYRYGSGCIVRGRTVLTAAHIVADAASVVVRDPDKREYTATVDPPFVGDVRGPGPDLALLEIDDPTFNDDLPGIGLAAVDRDSGEPVERCHAVGYPWFAETRSRTAVRDTVDAIGVIPVMAKLATGLLSVQVAVTPRELPPQETTLGASEWSGMSGAPVVANGCLLGVVTEHAPREGPSAVMAVPLTALQADPTHQERGPGVKDPAAWWSRLGVGGIGELQLLPVPPPPRPEPEYWATLRAQIGQPLHERMPQLLGRERELAEIAAFATGGEGYRWLVGGAFAGKTALLYEAVTAGLPDEVDVVCYFLSRRASDASRDRFLAAVVPQLAYLCDVDRPVADVDPYYALWERAVDRATKAGRHLLLVVDGLDEDLCPPGSPGVASLLPTLVGAHAHVLVASRPHPELPDDVPVTPTQLSPFQGAQQLADLAKKEINDLTHGDKTNLAVDILGLLTAAAGPLSVMDLVALRSDGQSAPIAADTLPVRRLVKEHAARSLERVGSADDERYQFAHSSLLEYARRAPDLCDPEYRQRIHHWAEGWQDTGWPTPAGGEKGTPHYLLDTYSSILAADQPRLVGRDTYPSILTEDQPPLVRLVGDVGWVDAAIQTAGVDSVVAALSTARSAAPAYPRVSSMLAAVRGQARHLRPPAPVHQPGYVLRQLCLQAAELGEEVLAVELQKRLLSSAHPDLVPQWTSRRANRALLAELHGPGGWVNAVAVLPDGRVVTGGRDGRVLMWDLAKPKTGPAELGHHHDVVTAVAAAPDGRVVSGGRDGRVLMWDPAKPKTGPAELGHHHDVVTAVAAAPDGRVVSGGTDGRVLMWDPAKPQRGSAELGHHHDMVTAVAAAREGVVSGGRDGRVLMWDPAKPKTGPAELGQHHGAVLAAAAADGRVVSGGTDGRVLMWNPAKPKTGPAELGHHHGAVLAVAVLPDGRVVSGGRDRRVRMWDPAAPGGRQAELGQHDGMVTAVAVTPDGQVFSGGTEGWVLMWDPAAPQAGPNEFGHHDRRVTAVAVAGEGVVSGGRDGRVLMWDPAKPRTGPTELGHHHGAVRAVAVLPDGRVVSCGQDRWVLMWNPAVPGAVAAKLGRHGVAALVALPDGRVVSGGHDGRVLMWNPAKPKAGPTELGGHDCAVTAVAALPDGRVVSSGTDGRVLMWNPAKRGARPAELGRHHGAVLAVAALPDGVVSGGIDGRVLMWNPAKPGARPTELGGHHGWVNSVAALPDGRVVSSGTDGQVRVWDAQKQAAAGLVECLAQAVAAGVSRSGDSRLALAHKGGGMSTWLIVGAPRRT